jgi:hypothetical protein
MNNNFSLDHIKNFSLNQQQDAKDYIKQYFVPLSNGTHAMLINGKYEIKEDSDVKRTYFNRMTKELQKWYFTEYTDIKTVCYKINKPVFFDDKINLCPKMKHEYKPFSEFSAQIKNKVERVLKFIFDIWCSKRQESYDFCLKWLSNMIKGNKNNSCLYLKSIQGNGKSTIPKFIRDHVLGHELSLETGSEPIKSRFNSILAGKLMVVLEELENFSVSEWQTVSTVLKRIITSNTINIQNKGVDAIETENINNYILISNNDAIKDDEGRRYFTLDLCTSRVGDHAYFDSLYGDCFNDEVGHAFYCYMMEIKTEAFNPQSYPLTRSKLDSITKRLDFVYDFLKQNYILQHKSIYCSVDELFEEYKIFVGDSHKAYGKIDFNKKLREIGIDYYKTNGGMLNRFKVSFDDLMIIANKFKWIHDLDEFSKSKVPINTDKLDNGLDDEYKSKYESSQKQIQELERQIEELKKAIKPTEPSGQVSKQKITKKKQSSPFDLFGDVDDDYEALTKTIMNKY